MNDMTLKDRFWSKVDKENGPVHPTLGRCWVWTGAMLPNGYGSITEGGRKQESAHRVAWELEHGPLADGVQVRHRCDNKPCVRGDHLIDGSHQDNMDDRDASGLTPKGESHGNAKLTEAVVRDIRARHAAGESYYAMAKRLGVDKSTVRRAGSGQQWSHV